MDKVIYILVVFCIIFCQCGRDKLETQNKRSQVTQDTISTVSAVDSSKLMVNDATKEILADDQWKNIVKAVNSADRRYLDSLTRFETARYKRHWKLIDLNDSIYQQVFSKYSWQDLSSQKPNMKSLTFPITWDRSNWPMRGDLTLKFEVDTSGAVRIVYCKIDNKVLDAIITIAYD